MGNKKYAVMLWVIASFSVISVTYAWTWSTSVWNGDSISADKWNALVTQLISVSVNPDWNSTTGYSRILNKPTIPAAQVNSDWNAASGVAQILNKPSIPAAQVNSDWNAASGVAQILNKPWTVSGVNQYSANTGNVGIGAAPAHKLDVAWTIWMLGKAVIYWSANDVYTESRVIRNTSATNTDGMYINYGSTDSANNTIKFYGAANAEMMRMKNNGNFWIWDADPQAKLAVTGNVNFSGNLNTWGRWQTDWYNINTGSIWAWTSIYSYGPICTSNASWNCTAAWGVVIWSTNDSATVNIRNDGIIKASRLNITNGGHYKMNLTHCSWACPGNHTLSTWTSAGWHNWTQVYNTDTTNFVKNAYGVVTLNQAGVYMIREQAMAVPAAATSYMGAAYYCPFINGSANCLWDVWLEHRYWPAWYRSQGRREYVAYLWAGTTVAWGYHPVQAMTNWCHDSYCSIEIIRIN